MSVTAAEPRRSRDVARDSAPAVGVRAAGVRLGGRDIWTDVDIDVHAGRFTALLGPNGAGKSTLLKAILGLQPLNRGSIEVLGHRPGAEANKLIGYLPQRHGFDAQTMLRGVDLVRLGLNGARWGVPLPVPARFASERRRRERERVVAAVEDVGAGAYADRPIGRLSGGEQQRLLIAQALVREPRMLILDEPLDSLDLASQRSIASLLSGICRRREVAVLLVAHDVNPLLAHLDDVVYLAGGSAVQGPVSEVIESATLSGLYGVPIEVLTTSDGQKVVVGQPEAPFEHGARHPAP